MFSMLLLLLSFPRVETVPRRLCQDAGNYIREGCRSGYTGPKCEESCPLNCYNCSQTFFELKNDKTCYLCNNGYYNGHYIDNPTYPLQLDCSLSCRSYCETCKTFKNCTRCKSQYFLNSLNECIPCIANCSFCESETDCLTCQDRYFWDGKTCQKCRPFCKKCTTFDNCLVCIDSFYLNMNTCFHCKSECLSCSAIGWCHECSNGHFLVNGRCIKCFSECLSCSLKGTSEYTCSKCKDGYCLVGDVCFDCKRNDSFSSPDTNRNGPSIVNNYSNYTTENTKEQKRSRQSDKAGLVSGMVITCCVTSTLLIVIWCTKKRTRKKFSTRRISKADRGRKEPATKEQHEFRPFLRSVRDDENQTVNRESIPRRDLENNGTNVQTRGGIETEDTVEHSSETKGIGLEQLFVENLVKRIEQIERTKFQNAFDM